MTAIWLAVEVKYWITKTAKIAAIAYPTLKRVLLFMIELRALTHGTPRRHIRLIQQSPWRDLDCGSLTMGTGRFGFNGGADCGGNAPPGYTPGGRLSCASTPCLTR